MSLPTPEKLGPCHTPGRQAIGLPRRYSVATMLTILTMFGLLFALLACVDATWVLYVVLAAFVTVVGLGQMFLFKGRRPREASLIAGSVALSLVAGLLVVVWGTTGEGSWYVFTHAGELQRVLFVFFLAKSGLLWGVVFAPAVGAALGYLSAAPSLPLLHRRVPAATSPRRTAGRRLGTGVVPWVAPHVPDLRGYRRSRSRKWLVGLRKPINRPVTFCRPAYAVAATEAAPWVRFA